MSILSFSNSWKLSNKTLYFSLLGLVATLSFIYGYFLLIEDVITIPWILGSAIETLERPLTYVSDSFLQIPITGKHFLIKEFYVAGDYMINSHWIYTFLGVFWFALMTILTVCTYMSRTWYMVSMALFVLSVVGMQPEQLLLFGWTGKSTLLLVLTTYLVPSYLFSKVWTSVSFLLRLLVFLIISATLAIIIHLFSEVAIPFYYLTSYGYPTFLFLCFIFILIISHEIIYGILFLSTYSKSSGGRNTFNLIVLSSIYMINLVLVYLKNMGTIDLNIIYVNTTVLACLSMLIGFWGFERKEALYKNVLPFNPFGAWLYLSLAIIFMSFNVLLLYTNNDPAIEVMEDAITFSHIGFGGMFLIYLLVNFWRAISQNYPVYKIAYKERNLPYFSVNIVGLVVAFILYSNTGSVSYYQAFGGYYNQLGDLYDKEGKTFLADQYFLESTIWGFKNHKANYSLARLYLKEGKHDLAKEAYKEALKKKPSPQVYVNLAQLYVDKGDFFEALFTLKEGLEVFPQNQKIKNNLALQYEKANIIDSAMIYLSSGDFNNLESTTSKINLSYIGTKHGLAIDEDSLKTLLEESDEQAVTSNLLAYKNTVFPKMAADLTFTGEFKQLNPYNAAYLNNSLIGNIYVKGSQQEDMQGVLNDVIKNPLNRDYAKSLHLLRSTCLYYNGFVSKAIQNSNIRSGNEVSMNNPYNRLLGLWTLEQGQPLLSQEYLSGTLRGKQEGFHIPYALAIMNSGQDNEVSEAIIDNLSLNDSILTQQALSAYKMSFSDILATTDDSLKYLAIKYRYKDQDINLAKTLIETIKNNNLKSSLLSEYILWNINRNRVDHVNELLKLATKEAAFDDYRKIAQLMNNNYAFDGPTKFTSPFYQDLGLLSQLNFIKSDSLRIMRAYSIGTKTPFNTVQIMVANTFLSSKAPDKAYQMLLKMGELNPYNTAIAQAYIDQALNQGFPAYAKDELSRIEPYLTYEEYQQSKRAIDLNKREKDGIEEVW